MDEERDTVQVGFTIPAKWLPDIDEMRERRGLFTRAEALRAVTHEGIVAHREGGKSAKLDEVLQRLGKLEQDNAIMASILREIHEAILILAENNGGRDA